MEVTKLTKAKYPYNAECYIDYKTKDISFNYTQDLTKKNTRKAYECHAIPYVIGSLIGLLLYLKIVIAFIMPGLIISSAWAEFLYPQYLDNIVFALGFLFGWLIIVTVLYYLCKIATRKVFGAISVLLHERYEYLRENYPKSNAFLSTFKLWIRKKFNMKPKFESIFTKDTKDEYITEDFVWMNNKLIVFDYNIVVAEYELHGDCGVLIDKVYTKCTNNDEKKKKDIEVMEFAIIFEFKKKPKDGKVIIR